MAVDDRMQAETSRCVVVDLAWKPEADADHLTIASALQCIASPELPVAVLVHTWLSAAAASDFLPGGWILSRGITTMPPPQSAVATTGP